MPAHVTRGDDEGGCRATALPGEAWTLERIVAAYIEHKRARAEAFLRWCARMTLAEAIESASYARTPGGKKHSHERRLPRAASEKAHAALRSARLGTCRTFDELHATVKALLDPIPKIGEMMVYDTALRLGAALKLAPDLVYLHRGTREGAVALGFDRRRDTVHPDELPAAFRALHPHEIEDCLCIYKAQLRQLR
jgi:hypothetical protein